MLPLCVCDMQDFILVFCSNCLHLVCFNEVSLHLRTRLLLFPYYFNLVKQHRIQLSGAKFDEVGLICGSSPLVRGSHWTGVLDCGPWMDQHM